MKDLENITTRITAAQASLFELWAVEKDAYTIDEFFQFFVDFYTSFMVELNQLEEKREKAEEEKKRLQRAKEAEERRRQGGLDKLSQTTVNMTSAMVCFEINIVSCRLLVHTKNADANNSDIRWCLVIQTETDPVLKTPVQFVSPT